MLKRLFGFNPENTTVRTEIMAGLTTFLTMAYILVVNPNILSAAGMDKGALFTTTIIASSFATLLMAFWAKLPFALAPGMGLNAFFAYTVCMTMGYSWEFALTAVFLEGIIFIILTVTNLREKIVDAIPESLKNAIGVGIGLFLAFLGLQNTGIIVKNDTTLLALGDITSGHPLLGFVGLIVTAIFLVKKVRGALLFGILLTTLIGIPMGITHIEGILSAPPSIAPIAFKLKWEHVLSVQMVVVVFTFLFMDLFDTIGTLVGVATKTGMMKDGKILRLKQAFFVDAVGTTVGAMLGTSTVTTFVESASGVGVGGRSGLTAFVTALCFLAALFLSPFFLAVPGAATAPILVLVGLMMISSIREIDLTDYSEAIPAFICIIFMPFACSISEGIVLGMLSYMVINLCCGNYRKLSWTMCILSTLFVVKYFI